jgi:S1-C subfamily serine protease
VLCVALTLILLAGTAPRAEAQGRALDHHATVLNGAVVGSAFAIAPDLALTNAHVVAGLRPGDPLSLTTEDPGGRSVGARVIAISPRMDLAVLRIPRGFLPVVPARDAPRSPGLRVHAAGVDASGGAGLGPRMELSGTVLATHADLPAFGPGLVARVPGVRPGFSGGPLVDGAGRLVGMVTAIRPGRLAQLDRVEPASGFAPRRGPRPVRAEEAFVLRAAEIRAEARRLLAAAQD